MFLIYFIVIWHQLMALIFCFVFSIKVRKIISIDMALINFEDGYGCFQ
jgi:hypothetical protein